MLRVFRLRKPRPTIVYGVWLSDRLLELFGDANAAFAHVTVLMERGKWLQSRPGRWWNGRGDMLQVKEHEVRQ